MSTLCALHLTDQVALDDHYASNFARDGQRAAKHAAAYRIVEEAHREAREVFAKALAKVRALPEAS